MAKLVAGYTSQDESAKKPQKSRELFCGILQRMFIRRPSSLCDGQVIKNRYHSIICLISFKR
jgi:hypothetical protein